MPIRPENRDKYPADWQAIRQRILIRAGNRCEWEGCDAPNHQYVVRSRDDREQWMTYRDAMQTRDGEFLGAPILIVLTVAHLDHDPRNNADDNLMALCQLHHLRYDRKHHAETRRTRKDGTP